MMKHKKKKKAWFSPTSPSIARWEALFGSTPEEIQDTCYFTLRIAISESFVSTSSNEETGGKGTLALKVLRRKVLKPTPAEHLFFH